MLPVVVQEQSRASAISARKEVPMVTKGAKVVGRFSVDFQVANHADILDAKRGLLEPAKVRRDDSWGG